MLDIQTKMQASFTDNEMPPYIYTYPTKKAYVPFSDWKQACSGWQTVTGPLAIYIHIPFCEMKCSFCDLFTVTKEPSSTIDRYVRAVAQEIRMMRPYLQTNKITVHSVYFGGGTPTLLNERQLSLILNELHEAFSFATNCEWSIEGAPNSFSEDKFKQLKAHGFNRLSLGIQTFNEDELQSMGRHYGADLGYTIAQRAVQSGIPNINLDLIYGIPGKDFKRWESNLMKAIGLQPATLTTYPLAIRNRTTYGKQMAKGIRQDWVETQLKYQWYDFTFKTLTENGYKQHTLVTYAQGSGGCKHEAIEFEGAPTLSFGVGSRKYAPDLHYVDEDYANRKLPKATMLEYIDAIEKNELIVRSAAFLNKHEQILRYTILSILASGFDLAYFQKRFGEDPLNRFASLFEALENESLAQRINNKILLTAKGRRYSSHIGHFIAENFGGEYANV